MKGDADPDDHPWRLWEDGEHDGSPASDGTGPSVLSRGEAEMEGEGRYRD